MIEYQLLLRNMNIPEAAQKLLSGELVVFPTETVYGLGAVANDDEAIQKIFKVKGRPLHNPLILHIADQKQLKKIVEEIPVNAQKLIDSFWPGPLTICFKKSDQVSDLVSAGLPTVCVRQPNNPIAHELLSAVKCPIAAPSANLSGRPSTTRLQDAITQLKGEELYFLDGGDTTIGLESTVVDCSTAEVKLLRSGSISRYEIEALLGQQIKDHSEGTTITSPGQLLSHYSPRGNLQVICGKKTQRRDWMNKHADKKTVSGLVGTSADLNHGPHQHLSHSEENLEEYAQNLYRFLNWCDHQEATHIILELPHLPEHKLFETLLNRLKKASKEQIIMVD